MQQAFDQEGVAFGDADSERESDSSPDVGGIVDTMGVTLWAMLSQAVFTGVQRSYRAAVQRMAVYSPTLSSGTLAKITTISSSKVRFVA